MRFAVLFAALALSGCGKTVIEYRDRVVTREVLVPVHQPCPAPSEVPVVPRRIAEENPTMPSDSADRERILGGKVAELQGYATEADAVMRACSRVAPE